MLGGKKMAKSKKKRKNKKKWPTWVRVLAITLALITGEQERRDGRNSFWPNLLVLCTKKREEKSIPRKKLVCLIGSY